MRIALIGASGYVGAKILVEALRRGHHVTAIGRRSGRLPRHPHLTVVQADVLRHDDLSRLLAGHDVVISAYNPRRMSTDPRIFEKHVQGHRAIISAVKKSGVKRFLAVGGAASLKTRAGVELLDSPEFPAVFDAFRPGIRGTRELYYLLKREHGLDWVFLSPSVMITPGPRTGRYRVGKDHILYDDKGNSSISLHDYAFAMLDELEHPKHHRERFTVGY